MTDSLHERCIVKDCKNHKDEGSFVGDLCSPCYRFITLGEGVHSQAYRNARATVIDRSKPMKEISERALKLYKPPFKFDAGGSGYIYDSNDEMVADEAGASSVARIRGWGRIKQMEKPEQLQDAAGELIARALTSFWQAHEVGR